LKGGLFVLVSISELKANAGKYVALANQEDIYITKNGKRVAKIISAKADKEKASQALIGLLPAGVDLNQAREERLSGK
jgi:prevent-host-death family protein